MKALCINRKCSWILLATWISLLPRLAPAAEAWEDLSGEALWSQISQYEEMRKWRVARPALKKYLEEDLSQNRYVEARFLLASAELEIARHSHDFAAFDAALATFETDFPGDAERTAILRRMWAESPVFVRDWAEVEERGEWYLATFPEAHDAMLVKMRIAHRKFADAGDGDGAISDLQTLLADEPNNPNAPAVAVTLANFIRQRDGREKSAAFLARYVPDGTTSFGDASLLHLQMAHDCYHLERYEEAAAHAAYVVDNDIYLPAAHDAVKIHAWSLWRMGRDFDALTFLEDAATSCSEISQLHQVVQVRTSFQVMLRGPGAAVASLEDLVNQHRNRQDWLLEDAFYMLAQIKAAADGPASALAELDALARAHPGTQAGATALYTLWSKQVEWGEAEGALATCEAYLEAYLDSSYADTIADGHVSLLVRTGRLDQAIAEAEARLTASETQSRQIMLPAKALSQALLRKARDLESQDRLSEAADLLRYAAESRDTYLNLATDDDILFTLPLLADWGRFEAVKTMARSYLASHPQRTITRDRVRLHLAAALGHEGSPMEVAEANDVLEQIIDNTGDLSLQSMADILVYSPLLRTQAINYRLANAFGADDDQAIARSLDLLADAGVSTNKGRAILRKQRDLFSTYEIPFPPAAESDF